MRSVTPLMPLENEDSGGRAHSSVAAIWHGGIGGWVLANQPGDDAASRPRDRETIPAIRRQEDYNNQCIVADLWSGMWRSISTVTKRQSRSRSSNQLTVLTFITGLDGTVVTRPCS